MKIDKKHILIGLVAITVIGGALYLHNKKKGKMSSADGDDEESNFTNRWRGTDWLKDTGHDKIVLSADGTQSAVRRGSFSKEETEIGTPNTFATVQGAFGKTPVVASNPFL
jgi:hypothetical protein